MGIVNKQEEKNRQRRKAYQEKMAWWVLTKGITHPAVEMRYLGTRSLHKKFNQVNDEYQEHLNKEEGWTYASSFTTTTFL